jgi:hypothetical protein
MARGSSGTTICGWCMTGNHEQCRPSLTYYEKTWYCTCVECHPEKEKETKNEVVEEPTQEVQEEPEA